MEKPPRPTASRADETLRAGRDSQGGAGGSSGHGAAEKDESRSRRAQTAGAAGRGGVQTTLDKYVTQTARKSTPYTAIKVNKYLEFERPKTARDDWLECSCRRDLCTQACSNYRLCAECSKTNHGGEDCGNQRLQRRQYVKSMPRPAGKKGYGLFAAEDIPPGSLIGEYVGEVIGREEALERISAATNHVYVMEIGGGMYVDASRYGNDTRFMNHSCDPNCETQKWHVGNEERVAIVAVRMVPRGEELTFDYRFESVGKRTPCFCGSPNCRGFLDVLPDRSSKGAAQRRPRSLGAAASGQRRAAATRAVPLTVGDRLGGAEGGSDEDGDGGRAGSRSSQNSRGSLGSRGSRVASQLEEYSQVSPEGRKPSGGGSRVRGRQAQASAQPGRPGQVATTTRASGTHRAARRQTSDLSDAQSGSESDRYSMTFSEMNAQGTGRGPMAVSDYEFPSDIPY